MVVVEIDSQGTSEAGAILARLADKFLLTGGGSDNITEVQVPGVPDLAEGRQRVSDELFKIDSDWRDHLSFRGQGLAATLP